MKISRSVNINQAYQIGDALNVNWQVIDINQFRRGLEVELEHGLVDNDTDVTHNDMLITGKIALAHLNELNDYYSRLEVIENIKFNTNDERGVSSKYNSSLLKGVLFGAAVGLFVKYIKNKKA